NAQHWGIGTAPAQPLTHIRWQAPVDLNPQYSGSVLYAHYGSPTVSAANTVVFPVKTGANDGFRIDARAGATGAVAWTMATDYSVPHHDWFPACQPTLTRQNTVVAPALGGTIMVRSSADAAAATEPRQAFYGIANYNANPAAYNGTVIINTPITADAYGNVIFGFMVTDSTPINLQSGVARVPP